jgi:hypothetical protein
MAHNGSSIIGDTFFKNDYTVFLANPASVGFAALAPNAQDSVTQGGVPGMEASKKRMISRHCTFTNSSASI